jgi:mycofactocin system FadH/OYE family oxidoreductase 2
MTTAFEYLFTPIRLGPVTLRNRIMVPPYASLFASEDYLPTERQVAHYGDLARGGAALIVMGGSVVHPNSLAHPGFNLISDERAIPGYRRIAQRAHEHGAKIFSQLSHHGRQTPSVYSRRVPWAPSPIPCILYRETPKEMEEEDIQEVIAHTAASARNVMEAGFDGVELYAAHGYLMSQFLSPVSNLRRDAYGGSLDSRLRFVVETARAVRSTIGPDRALGLRLNGDDFTPGGLTPDDCKEIAQRLDALELFDYFSISGTTYYAFPLIVPDGSFPPGLFVHLASGIKSLVRAPVGVVGRINSALQAEKILADGHADLIAMARALLADPELPSKARAGRLDDIRPCIACNEGCIGREIRHAPISCTVNPAVGLEATLGIETLATAPRRRRVLVVGGGPAGLEAARVAALRGHEVTLVEAADGLGGQALLVAKLPSRQEFEGLVRWLERQVRQLCEVRLGTTVSADDVSRHAPDAVIVATGSVPLRTGYTPVRPDVSELPGVVLSHVLTVPEIFGNGGRVGDRVVLVDEIHDWGGLGVAEYLAAKGKQVHVVSRLLHAGMDINPTSLGPLYGRLRKGGVELHAATVVTEILPDSVRTLDLFTNAKGAIGPIDTVVLAMGSRARNELARALKGRVSELHVVGDCLAPRRVLDAVYEGHLAGRAV